MSYQNQIHSSSSSHSSSHICLQPGSLSNKSSLTPSCTPSVSEEDSSTVGKLYMPIFAVSMLNISYLFVESTRHAKPTSSGTSICQPSHQNLVGNHAGRGTSLNPVPVQEPHVPRQPKYGEVTSILGDTSQTRDCDSHRGRSREFENNSLTHRQSYSLITDPYEPIGYAIPVASLRPKPNQSNYISCTKALILKAIDLYMIRIYTINLFPDAMTAAEWAAQAWSKVCNEAERNFDPNNCYRVYKLVCYV
jgi:hypothetical protein